MTSRVPADPARLQPAAAARRQRPADARQGARPPHHLLHDIVRLTPPGGVTRHRQVAPRVAARYRHRRTLIGTRLRHVGDARPGGHVVRRHRARACSSQCPSSPMTCRYRLNWQLSLNITSLWPRVPCVFVLSDRKSTVCLLLSILFMAPRMVYSMI